MMNAVLGRWHLTMRTPIGVIEADMIFEPTPDGIVGSAIGRSESVPLERIVVEPLADGEERVTWTQRITRPMRLDLAFDVTVRGDELTGVSRAGRLPATSVRGTRQDGPDLRRDPGRPLTAQ